MINKVEKINNLIKKLNQIPDEVWLEAIKEVEEESMEEYEKNRIENCINNIQDKLEAIKKEMQLDKPYKYYILEKIEPIIFDANCIKSICESEEN